MSDARGCAFIDTIEPLPPATRSRRHAPRLSFLPHVREGWRVVSREMPAGLHKVLFDQRIAFVKKFGRDPGPGEPIFFDPDKDAPTPAPLGKIHIDVVEAMLKAGFDEAEVKAFLRALTA